MNNNTDLKKLINELKNKEKILKTNNNFDLKSRVKKSDNVYRNIEEFDYIKSRRKKG